MWISVFQQAVSRSCPGEEIFTVPLLALSQVAECCSVSTRIPHFTCWTWAHGFWLLGMRVSWLPLPGAPLAAPWRHLWENRSISCKPLDLSPPCCCILLTHSCPGEASPQAHGLHDYPFPHWHCSCSLRGCVVPVGGWWSGWNCHSEGFRCALLQTIAVCPHYICSDKYKRRCLFCIGSCIYSLWGAGVGFSGCKTTFFSPVWNCSSSVPKFGFQVSSSFFLKNLQSIVCLLWLGAKLVQI